MIKGRKREDKGQEGWEGKRKRGEKEKGRVRGKDRRIKKGREGKRGKGEGWEGKRGREKWKKRREVDQSPEKKLPKTAIF